MRSKQHGKRERQERSIERIQVNILDYEEKLNASEDAEEKKLLKKRIERSQTTIKNTKSKMI
jgi:hypothetical protein